MHTPRNDKLRLIFAALLLTFSAAPRAVARQDAGPQPRPQEQQQPPSPRAPSPEVERGKLLLEQGDAEGAVAVLRPAAERDRADGDAWHLLGLAYARRGKQQDATKALGVAVAARLDRLSLGVIASADRYAKMNADERARATERALKLYGDSLESVEAYLAQQPADAELWRAQAAAIKAHMDYVRTVEGEFAAARPESPTARIVIEDKPEPGYTEEARRHNTGGRVRIRAIFGADGKVLHPLATRPLPHGLTEKAFEAARRVRFRPATVDGRPVAQFITLEYGFAIDRRGINAPIFGPGARARPRP